MFRKIRMALVSVVGIAAVLLIAGCSTMMNDRQPNAIGARAIQERGDRAKVTTNSSDLILDN